jgi:PPOX class probable F420-dependent enzyme
MPAYGIREDADGLLSWDWAVEQLRSTRNVWLATAWPDGRPHVMPVWAVWDDDGLLFSCARDARKAKNLFADPRCVATNEDGQNPVVLEGVAAVVEDVDGKQRYLDLVNPKYDTDHQMDFLDPATTVVFRIRPTRVTALREEAFTDSPTRWDLA